MGEELIILIISSTIIAVRAAAWRQVVEALAAEGIGSQVHYIPVHAQPYYVQRYGPLNLPGAAAWYRQCLSLPLFPAMADDDVDRVVDALSRALGLD